MNETNLSPTENPKSRHEILIRECGEVLIPIPQDGMFAFFSPHSYLALGAPYGDANPFLVREGVAMGLQKAASILCGMRPGFRLRIFDAYRPVAVQAFMVRKTAKDYAYRILGIQDYDLASPEIHEESEKHAFQLWAMPSMDPKNPPPHSTGAVIDLTIEDDLENLIPMGSEIDELEGSHPDHFAGSENQEHRQFHQNRELLRTVMEQAGFTRLWHEWWHFSMGDQYAAFVATRKKWERGENWPAEVAKYGRV